MHVQLTGVARTLAALGSASLGAFAAPGGQTIELLANDGASNDQFGRTLGIDASLALVGAPQDDDNGADSGSAYLFDPVTGQQLLKLLPTDGAASERFGCAVAIDGGLALVGATHDDANGLASGSAYVFDTLTGLQTMKLLPIAAGVGDEFGFSVAIHGTTAVVGSKADDHGTDSGAAYVYDVTTGQELAKLLPNDGAGADYFGFSVGVSGTIAIVGAPRDDDNGENSGSAYLFDTTTGQQLFKLLPDGGTEFSGFGWSVAIDGPLAIVGAVHDGTNGAGAGAAYLFDTTTGEQLARLVANDPTVEDSLGYSVAIDGARAIVGAAFDNVDGAPDAGSAYVFDTTTGQQIAQIHSADLAAFDSFGFAVAIHGTTALVGSTYADDLGPNSGSAQLFDTTQAIAEPYCFGAGAGTPCPCLNFGAHGHGCANGVFAQGARLLATGSPCVLDDDLVLRTTSTRPNQPGLFFQGLDALNDGAGFAFGDGLRCAGTGVMRLQLVFASANGTSSTTVPIAALTGLVAGDVRRYQWWYRDPGASPCGTSFNLSNGLSVTWGA